jgi:hypothetical protein
MLKIEKEITEATCDACGKDLRYFMKEGEKCRMANYGEVIPSFGYGSDLDPIGGNINPHYHLCEECFAKALHAINLPVSDFDPVICPVCRKGRNGKDDHPECMKNWYPHPDSIPQKELRAHMEEREKEYRRQAEGEK